MPPPLECPPEEELIMSKQMNLSMALAVAFLAGLASLRLPAADPNKAEVDKADADKALQAASGSGKERFFEMRTYYAAEGKIDALNARFRNHTNRLFQKHGMDLVGYWQPVDKKDVLIYILAYPSRDARDKSWKDFTADPDWKSASKESEKNGKLVAKVESVYMTPTDYSPIK
jgi:NIPSNAP protein